MNKSEHSDASLTKAGRFLSCVLRHRPESIGIELDKEGWVDIELLLRATQSSNHKFTVSKLHEIVEKNDKKRFAISADGLKIRAVQGHSAKNIDLSFDEKKPPDVLFHGTASRFFPSIMGNGLIAKSRHYVHLSYDESVAYNVGKRYGEVILLQIDCRTMHEDGFKFFIAENGVWLTKIVPPRYITRNPDGICRE